MLDDVSLSNPPGFTQPSMAHLNRIEARIALGELLHRRVAIERIVLVTPTVDLERDAAGHPNWIFDPPAPAASVAAAPTTGAYSERRALSVGAIEVSDATIKWEAQTITVARLAVDPTTGSAKLSTAMAGRIAIGDATFVAASLTDPVAVTAHATLGSVPLSLTGHVGSLATLLAGAVDLQATAPTLTLTAKGTLTTAGGGTLAIGMTSPDLRAAGQLAGLDLPTMRNVQATAELALQPGTADLTNLHLASAQGDLEGDLLVLNAGRLSLRGAVASRAFDLDALAPPPASPQVSPSILPPGANPSATPALQPQPTRLIPDTPLPLDALRQADADLTVTLAALHVAGATYTNVGAHAALTHGILRLDPVSMTLGTVTAHATLLVDAAATPPTMHATIDAPGLPFGAVLALAGGAAGAPGTLDVRLDLNGSGATMRAIASTLTGRAGLALVDAQVDNALLGRLAAGSLRAAGVSLDEAGTTAVRCAAIAADATAGQLRFSALTVDTSRVALDGSGAIDLATESLDLHLRPELRLGGGLSVPVRVQGTLAAPRAQLDPGALASGRVGIVLGGPPPPDRCGPALAVAREGQAGPAAAAAAPPRKLKPADLLRGLLR